MSDPNTLRVLSFDGGGERGYLSLSFFKKFVQLWGIDPATLAQRFDVISGTSIGGIMGLAIAFGKTLDEIEPYFTVQGPYLFSLGTNLIPPPIVAPLPYIRPSAAYKVALIAAGIPFYQSSGPYAQEYGYGLLKATLESQFGLNTLQNLKTNVIIPSYEQDTKSYVLFSNLDYPEFMGQNELISNVALATGAAPAYLPPLVMNGHTYLDGGLYQNNPASFGRTLSTMIKPLANTICVLSIGTGIGEIGFNNDGIPDPDVPPDDVSTIETLFSLFNIASTGGQESVAQNMFLESTENLSKFYYYRFQPKLDPNLNTELDNTDADILLYYQTVANDHFNDDIENISIFLGHLMA